MRQESLFQIAYILITVSYITQKVIYSVKRA
jgi:hypothetical protein